MLEHELNSCTGLETTNMDFKSNEKKMATLNCNRYFQSNYAKIDTLLKCLQLNPKLCCNFEVI